MSARDEHKYDPEEAALLAESRRLIAELDELIERAKILKSEHRGIIERIRDKRQHQL